MVHVQGTPFNLHFLHVDNYYCISPNVGRYYGLVTGPPPAMEAMEAMEAEAAMAEAAAMETATERF